MFQIALFFLRRYFHSPRKEWMRSDSFFMILGIVLSVATLTVSQSIFEGYENVLKDTILGVNSHIYVFKPGEANLDIADIEFLQEFLKQQQEVASYAPVIMNQAMATNGEQVKGCLIRGIDWEKAFLPTAYRDYIIRGSWRLPGMNNVVIGYRLAQELNLGVNDTLTLISIASARVTPLGVKPREERYLITGIYKSGMYEYDSKFLFMNLDAAHRFTGMSEEYSMLEVGLEESYIEEADYLAYRWETLLNQEDYNYQISSWIDFNGNLFALLKLEKWVIFIILSFLVLIASFNVISSVSTAIISRRKDLGILLAFGTSRNILQKIFLSRSLSISLVSVCCGLILGILIALGLSWQKFFLLKADVYFLEKINVSIELYSLGLIFAVSMLVVFVATVLPLRKITKLQVTTILRH